MKLRNKKTGEIGTLYQNGEGIFYEIWVSASGHKYLVDSLAELNDEWEDYEEPKEFWFIDSGGEVVETTYITDYDKTNLRKFGNYFETREEAEKAVEKLKAWKRLKDKGFEFESWWGGTKDISFWLDTEIDEDIAKDLDLLFGGE